MNPTWLLVGAVYALAVWLARRAGLAELRWRVAALFYLLVLIFMFRPMTQQFVNVPVDFIQSLPPWTHVTRNHNVWNRELNDVVLQIVPWAHQARQAWRSGELPLWNHLAGSGYPLLGNGQSSPFSIVRLLALPLPLGYAMTAEAALKLLMAMTFTFLYCRRRGYEELACAFAAVTFGFSTFLIVWLHFPLVTTAVFLPAVMLQIDLLIERRTFGRFAFAALLWAAMLFGGHPETVSHIFFLAVLYLLWLRPPLETFLTLAGAMVVAALIASPFLATFGEAVTKSKRYQELKVSPNLIGYYSDFPSQVILLQPFFYGEVPFEKAWGPEGAESITGFAGVIGVAAWLGVFLRALIHRKWRSIELFFALATLLILGIILAWPVVAAAFHKVFFMAANARLRLLLCFVLSVQSAMALDLVLKQRAKELLIGIAVVAATLLWLMRMAFPNDYNHDTAMVSMLPSLLVLLIAALTPLLGKWRAAGVMLLLVVTIGELWRIDSSWNPVLPERLMYPRTPLIEKLTRLEAAQPKTNPIRIVGTGPVFFPNAPAIYGFEDVRAHDPMANGRYLGLLRVVTGYDPSDYFAKWVNLDTRMLDFLGVKYVVSSPRATVKDPQRFPLVYDGKDGRIFENRDVLPRFYPTPNVVLEFKRDHFVKRMIRHEDWAHTAVLNKLPVENDQERLDLLAPRPIDAPKATLQMTSVRPTD
ncbi:MAG TPA: YfhO family protein, partial [Thermoanaerobaculia bacterium]|nr:YfhO family protein [Thermoanaerobaculia bacterium]